MKNRKPERKTGREPLRPAWYHDLQDIHQLEKIQKNIW